MASSELATAAGAGQGPAHGRGCGRCRRLRLRRRRRRRKSWHWYSRRRWSFRLRSLPAGHQEAVVVGPVLIGGRGASKGDGLQGPAVAPPGRGLHGSRWGGGGAGGGSSGGVASDQISPGIWPRLQPWLHLAVRAGIHGGPGPGFLPGFPPVILVFEDPVELVLHPAAQPLQTRQRSGSSAFPSRRGPRSRPGSRHPIHQLPASAHQAIDALLQAIGAAPARVGAPSPGWICPPGGGPGWGGLWGVGVVAAHGPKLPTPGRQPMLPAHAQQGDGDAGPFQAP
jgi:hypothetical protein